MCIRDRGFGGQLNDRWVGNLAPATAMSFFPGKALGAYGDAGAILTQDADDVECWESIRWHGTDDVRKNSVRVGFNGRMDSFQAGVLLEKLSIADDELEARRHVANYYNERMSLVGRPQANIDGAQSGYNYYSLCVSDREKVAAFLKEKGVPTAVYYSTPLHKMPAFEKYAPNDGLKVTEQVSDEILSLPMHPYLSAIQMEYICDCVEAAVKANRA